MTRSTLDPSIAALETRIERRAQVLGVAPEPDVRRRLAAYVSVLYRWNRRINLVAFEDPDKAIDRLILEPLVAARWIPDEAGALIDIGSGGGSPAIPLKLAVPRLAVLMIESRVRKAAFLREMVRELELKDARVERARFEALAESPEFAGGTDVVTVRAVRVGVSELRTLAAMLRPRGLLLWFRARQGPQSTTAALEVVGDHTLVPAMGSQLRVLRKLEQ